MGRSIRKPKPHLPWYRVNDDEKTLTFYTWHNNETSEVVKYNNVIDQYKHYTVVRDLQYWARDENREERKLYTRALN